MDFTINFPYKNSTSNFCIHFIHIKIQQAISVFISFIQKLTINMIIINDINIVNHKQIWVKKILKLKFQR